MVTNNGFPGELQPDALYRQSELMARLGWSRRVWDKACREGLAKFVRVLARRHYVLGRDAIQFISQQPTKQQRAEADAVAAG